MHCRFTGLASTVLAALLALAAAPTRADEPPPAPLARLIDEALAHNPELAAARAAGEAAQQRVAPAAALEDPMLEAGVLNAPLPGLNLNREDMTMRMLGVSQKLPFPGKRDLRGAVARADAASVAAATLEARNRLVRDLRVAYGELQLLAIDDRLVLRTRGALQELDAATDARFTTGQATQAEALAVQAQLAQLQLEQLRLQGQQATQQATLRRLLGRNSDEPIVALPATLHSLRADAATLRGESMERRPQLHGLEAMAGRDARALELAQRERYPDFDVRLSYGQRQRAPDGVARDDMVSVTVSVNLPIWRQGRTEPRIAEARARQHQSESLLESQRQESRALLAQQLALIEQNRASAVLYGGTLLPQAQAVLDSALNAWRAGRGGISAVLEAQRALYQYERAAAEAIVAHNQALAEIDLLTGVAPTGVQEFQP
jgi:outer membrane protein TolC